MVNPLVVVSGLGSMGREVAKAVASSAEMDLARYAFDTNLALAGPHFFGSDATKETKAMAVAPCEWSDRIDEIRRDNPGVPIVAVDFTAPSAGVPNAERYCLSSPPVPFVMGTTSIDYSAVNQLVAESGNVAVVAPNFAVPILLLLEAMQYVSNKYPNILRGWYGAVDESHQAAKLDVSGTAEKKWMPILEGLGVLMADIRSERDPIRQMAYGISENDTNGHGHHFINVGSPDGCNRFGVYHTVNRRSIYLPLILHSIVFLADADGSASGRVFSAEDMMELMSDRLL